MIKIGITGHRNLKEECIPYYRDRVRDILVKLKEKDEDILVYSALADGADRLVVEVAQKLGIDYVAVLPMPKDIYMTDYDAASQVIYSRLFDAAISVIKIPLVENNSLSSILDYSEERDLQYEAAGFYMSDHCDILIAFWDGEYTQLKGGTSEIVKHHLAKRHYKLYHLLVSRINGLTKDMVEFKIYEK